MLDPINCALAMAVTSPVVSVMIVRSVLTSVTAQAGVVGTTTVSTVKIQVLSTLGRAATTVVTPQFNLAFVRMVSVLLPVRMVRPSV